MIKQQRLISGAARVASLGGKGVAKEGRDKKGVTRIMGAKRVSSLESNNEVNQE